ncbi:unnamed protein product [Closterium sp. NIES-54]
MSPFFVGMFCDEHLRPMLRWRQHPRNDIWEAGKVCLRLALRHWDYTVAALCGFQHSFRLSGAVSLELNDFYENFLIQHCSISQTIHFRYHYF